MKCNVNSNKRQTKFFRVWSDNKLRWAKKERDINNPKKFSEYPLQHVYGLLYGKCTDTFHKKSNQKLNNW